MSDLFEQLEKCVEHGYTIEYMAVNQIANGYKNEVLSGRMPLVTYTAYVIRIEDGEVVYDESCDHIEECLRNGLEWVRSGVGEIS